VVLGPLGLGDRLPGGGVIHQPGGDCGTAQDIARDCDGHVRSSWSALSRTASRSEGPSGRPCSSSRNSPMKRPERGRWSLLIQGSLAAVCSPDLPRTEGCAAFTAASVVVGKADSSEDQDPHVPREGQPVRRQMACAAGSLRCAGSSSCARVSPCAGVRLPGMRWSVPGSRGRPRRTGPAPSWSGRWSPDTAHPDPGRWPPRSVPVPPAGTASPSRR
jgi:hypothetical protein